MTSVMPLRGRTPFQDEAGQYPALDGCAPASIGKRAAGRLLDSALGMAVAIVSYLPAMVVSATARTYSQVQAAEVLVIVSQVATIAVFVGFMVMLCVKGSFPGGWLLGIRQVTTEGKVPGFAGLAKYLLQGLLSAVTCDIGLLVSILVIKPPLNRAWYDKASGIVVIDIKEGRNPLVGVAAPVDTPAVVPAPREAVVSVGASTPEVAGKLAVFDETSLVSPLTPPAAAVIPPVQRTTPISTPAVVGVEDDGMIVGVPWRKEDPVALSSFSPPSSPPIMSVREATPAPVSPDFDLEDRTVVSLEAIVGAPARGALTLVSDDGQRIPLDKVTVVGRNPSTPDGYPDARTHSLPDTTMSVSKTHVILGPDPDGVWVQDLRSTNGTAITTANGMRTAVPAGGRVVAGLGALVHIGKVAFRVTEQ